MTCRESSLLWVFAPALSLGLIAGCSSDDSASGSESDSATGTASETNQTTDPSSSSGTATVGSTDPTTTGTASNSNSSSSGVTTSPTAGETETTVDPTTGSTGPVTATDSDSDSSTGTGTSTTTGPECTIDDDCPGEMVCVEEACEAPPECVEDADCGEEQYCDVDTCTDKCKPGDGGMMGMVEESYIWVPSQNDGTVSKVDTLTLTEIARYRTGPNGGSESGSRTALSADGRFVVINARGTGRTTMIAANLADCVDTNNDNVITTSQNKDDVLAWGQDECVVWSLVHPEWGGSWANGPRGITWTVGTWNDDPDVCAWEDPKVWVGYRSKTANTAHLVELDGATGTVDEIVPVNNWVGQSSFSPYGGALDPEQRPWFSALRGEIVRVNTDQDPVTVSRWTAPSWVASYGFTVDKDGNPWMGGCSGPVSTFDVDSEQWIKIEGTQACHRGVAIDQDFHVWVASNGPCELVEIDGATRTLIKKHKLPKCATAIGPSVDVEGHLWIVDQGGWAFKIIDKDVPNAQLVTIPGSHYVYSDMTGGQLLSVVPM